MKVDAGMVLGLSGLIVGLGSLIYARDQSLAQREQVREAARQTDEMRRSQHYEASHALMLSTIEARQATLKEWRDEEWTALVRPGTPVGRMGALVQGNYPRIFVMRMYTEQLQEMYFARKNDQVTDDHWRAMRGIMGGFLGPPLYRALFDEFAASHWLTPEFVTFMRDFATTRVWRDPLARLPDEPALPDPVVSVKASGDAGP